MLQAITPDYILKEHSPNGTCCAMCVTSVHPEMTPLQGLLAEFLVTSILVLVVCSVFDRRNAHNTDSVSIKFGLTVAAIAMNEVWFTSGLFLSFKMGLSTNSISHQMPDFCCGRPTTQFKYPLWKCFPFWTKGCTFNEITLFHLSVDS